MACPAFSWLLHPSRPLSDLAAVPGRHRSGRWAGCLWGPVGVGPMGDGIPSSVARHRPPRRGPPDSGLVGAAVGGRHGDGGQAVVSVRLGGDVIHARRQLVVERCRCRLCGRRHCCRVSTRQMALSQTRVLLRMPAEDHHIHFHLVRPALMPARVTLPARSPRQDGLLHVHGDCSGAVHLWHNEPHRRLHH